MGKNQENLWYNVTDFKDWPYLLDLEMTKFLLIGFLLIIFEFIFYQGILVKSLNLLSLNLLENYLLEWSIKWT